MIYQVKVQNSRSKPQRYWPVDVSNHQIKPNEVSWN